MRSIMLGGGTKTISVFFLVVCLMVPALAGDPRKMINAGADHVAIRGYDTVAYFTEGKPMKGKRQFAFTWRDVTWQFASAKHKDLFAAEPQRYAPQFGGFCAMAMTNGVVLEVDPNAWTIADNKLYLNFSLNGRGRFRKDVPGNITKSEARWTALQKKN